jgi:hypothetical protein
MPKKDKKLKTEQLMKVQIGHLGIIEIGHKTEIGKVSQVIEMGNEIRKEKGLRPIELKEILVKKEFWEFVVARNTQKFKYSQKTENTGFSKSPDLRDFKTSLRMEEFSDFNSETNQVTYSNFGELEKYQDLVGQIQYTELMKKFPHLIKSKRGKNGGTWAELYILLKIASMLDKDLEVEIYRVFIEENILKYRDDGGDNFKEFNKLVDTLPDRIGKNNTGVYVAVAKMIRAKLEILDTKGYNEKEHNSLVQINRSKWLENLSFVIENGFVNSYEELKETFQKLKVIEKE